MSASDSSSGPGLGTLLLLSGPAVSPLRTALAGVRSLDDWENIFVKESGVHVSFDLDLRSAAAELGCERALSALGMKIL
jgi:hypothetical protein